MKKLLVVLGLLCVMTPAFAGDRFASIDLEKVLRSYNKTSTLNTGFQKEEADIRLFVLDAQKKVLSAKDSDKKSLEEKYNKELQGKVDALQKKKVDALATLENDIKAEIEKIGRAGNYDLILSSTNALYGTIDITDQIVKALNSGK